MSTVVLIISDYETAMWGHIGDSRLYFFRDGRIIHQTKDRSYSQAKANAGVISNEQIRKDADRNRLLKVLGMKGSIFPDILREPLILQQSDAILLCTDGFWENVTEDNMEKALGEADSPQGWLERMEAWICSSGKELDNYSAIGLFVK